MRSMNQQKIFIIIDGNAIIHRAYHALPPMTTKDGTIVNAVFGFTSMLFKVITDLKPEYIAVSFDVAGPTFRDTLYEKYKATRVKADQDLYDQIPLVYQIVEAFGIPIFTKQGFEADDVIATVVTRMKNKKSGIKNIIVTGDMDLLQLVDDDVIEVYLLRKGLSDIELYNEKKVKERFGFGPEHVVDYKSLKGDTSDNIPGVKGIGEKTAKELIEKIGGVEEIYREIKSKKLKIKNLFTHTVIQKLEQGERDARMSRDLATVRPDIEGIDVDIDACDVKKLNTEGLKKTLTKFEFFSLIKRIPERSDSQQHSSTPTPQHAKKTKKKSITVVEEKNLDAFLKTLKNTDMFVCKEVLSGNDPLTSDLSGLIFLIKNQPYFVKNNEKSLFAIAKNGFSDPKKNLVGHDIKQLVKALTCHGIEIQNKLFDIMIASYVLNSNTRAHDLPNILMREIGVEPAPLSTQGSLFGTDPQALADGLFHLPALYKKYTEQLKSIDHQHLFDTLEMALIPVLAHMERAGVSVDVDLLRKLSKEFADEIKKLEKKIWKEAGAEFNVASSVQLREILFKQIKLPMDGIKKGKTGFSTAASELEKLRFLHPIIPLIEEHRELSKLQNTYVDVLPSLINKKTERIHARFNQAVATTGRLSSSDPNLQNIPIRTETGKKIRDAFVAKKGYALIAADYSQIELRIVASLAKDKKLIEIFEAGDDVHRATAAAINGIPLEKVTKELRRAAKEINFGVLYGMGAYGLSWRAGIPQHEAKEFIEKYFREFSGVKKWIDATLAFAKKEGYVETMFGRRRYIPELKADNFQLRSAGERMAVNMPIQGTAADMMKMAMIRVYENIQTVRHKNIDVQMILQVHDELVLEVKKGLEDGVAEMVKKEMEHVVDLLVPVIVDVHVGKRWGEIK